jgi:hypothetical protein
MPGPWREVRPLLDGFRVLARLLPQVDRRRSLTVVCAAALVAVSQVGVGVATGTLIGRVLRAGPLEGWSYGLVVALPGMLFLFPSPKPKEPSWYSYRTATPPPALPTTSSYSNAAASPNKAPTRRC